MKNWSEQDGEEGSIPHLRWAGISVLGTLLSLGALGWFCVCSLACWQLPFRCENRMDGDSDSNTGEGQTGHCSGRLLAGR